MRSFIDARFNAEYLTQSATGRGVRVAVIDTGVDATHPDLVGHVTRGCLVRQTEGGAYECEERAPQEIEDVFGHGTAVAGIIASIAPHAEIISVRTLDHRNSCSSEGLLAAFKWCLDQKIGLINLSLATSRQAYMPRLLELCEKAYAEEAIIVASKRNFGDIGCPAMFSSVISVDNANLKRPHDLKFLPQSVVEFAARGTGLKVAAPKGRHQIVNGTSFATPHVTGIVALLCELYPNLLSWEAKTLLKALAIPINERPGTPG